LLELDFLFGISFDLTLSAESYHRYTLDLRFLAAQHTGIEIDRPIVLDARTPPPKLTNHLEDLIATQPQLVLLSPGTEKPVAACPALSPVPCGPSPAD
jgi:hypothetical protein